MGCLPRGSQAGDRSGWPRQGSMRLGSARRQLVARGLLQEHPELDGRDLTSGPPMYLTLFILGLSPAGTHKGAAKNFGGSPRPYRLGETPGR
eukprot:8979853-Alexandrium_andersonii.AAC.1